MPLANHRNGLVPLMLSLSYRSRRSRSSQRTNQVVSNECLCGRESRYAM